ncbi:Putative Nudix hydrolase family protein; putative ADP-ribose pyrophosphatase [Bradyrhizobium sp. ORS 278]|uniref:NUDIX hydrolase n=1 Tax=Bradyrhizobium sp. (strain ORS 278) TaxID=114615 RepID=UPI00015079D2|nr:NUDIX domain-containing protein [Bradyrhizobium sp. ORS 278]CAL75954.1 Putative Nudix hydrolase family protein; putative ADP-ribose pyrophosphatase [Bradyrhizobium sp. ORS 278]
MIDQHQRPYLASYCMLRVNDSILLQRRFNTGYLDGLWALPSGHVNTGEDAISAASRELREETGLVVKPDAWRFVCAMHRQTDRTIIDLFFATDVFAGEPKIRERDKSDGLEFFPLDTLPRELAGYVGVAIRCLLGQALPQGSFYMEGWG